MTAASTPCPEPAPDSRARRIFKRSLATLLFAAAVIFLWRTAASVGWRELGGRISGAHPVPLVLAGSLALARYAIWCTRWWILMRPVARPRWWIAFRSLMAAVFFNTVIPATRSLGGLVRAGFLARSLHRPLGPLYGAALVDQFGYAISTLVLGALSLAVVIGGARAHGSQPLIAAAGLALATVMVLVLSRLRAGRFPDFIARRLPRRVAGAIEGTVEGSVAVLARPSSWAVMAAGGAAVWGANVIVLYLSGRAIGAPIDLSAAAVAWSVGGFFGSVSGTPGGAGTTESAAIVQLLALGVPASEALPAVALARGFEYAVDFLIGGPCAVWSTSLRS